MKDIENVAAHISNANLVHPLILSESDLGIVRGITKRELFAAMNLQALLTCQISFSDAVTRSVDLADKLLEELEKTKK